MTIKTITIVRLCVLATILAAITCSRPGVTDSTSGGSSSEVVAIIGTAKQADGTVVANALVRLRADNYLQNDSPSNKKPAPVVDVRTDNLGTFRIDSILPGNYSLEISDQKALAVAIGVNATLDSNEMHMGTLTLKPVSRLSGTIKLSDDTPVPVHVMVYGLERRIQTDSLGKFIIPDMPEGTYALCIEPADLALGQRDIASVEVGSGQLLTIDTVTLQSFSSEQYSSWGARYGITINTSASGAGVNTTTSSFPLLIRLNSTNFDFSTSRSFMPGSDIRFADTSGKHLPYQIERWDSKLRQAEIWVRMDSLRGNDSSQIITMYCGNGSAATWNNSVIFDTADGFAAVWHLGNDLVDVTQNSIAGNDIKTTLADGIIGTCRSFNGSSSFIKVDSSSVLNMAGKKVSIMVWQKCSRQYTSEHMYFEHDQWPNAGDYGFSTPSPSTLSLDFPQGDNETRFTGKVLNDNTWHLVVAMYDPSTRTGRLFIDGDSVFSAQSSATIGSSSAPSFMGSRGGTERFFEGYLDEMRICSKLLDNNHIKLIFENQRADQKLISIKPL